MENSKKQFVKELSHFRFGMLTTISLDEGLHTRPMAIGGVEESGEFFLLADEESVKVKELVNDRRVTFSCQDDGGRYVSVSGIARLEEDVSKIADMWNLEFDAWFPKGKEQALLIRIVPHAAEYWDMKGPSKLMYAYKLMKAQIMGTQPNVEDYHGRI